MRVLAKIKGFLLGNAGADDTHSRDELHLAAAALLVDAASHDGHFDDDERTTIRRIAMERFGLDAEAAEALIDAATEKAAEVPELFGFTRTVRAHFSHQERIEMMEMLWEVAYADGALHDYEANLLRRVTGLLYVTDQESGAARKRVLDKLGVG